MTDQQPICAECGAIRDDLALCDACKDRALTPIPTLDGPAPGRGRPEPDWPDDDPDPDGWQQAQDAYEFWLVAR